VPASSTLAEVGRKTQQLGVPLIKANVAFDDIFGNRLSMMLLQGGACNRTGRAGWVPGHEQVMMFLTFGESAETWEPAHSWAFAAPANSRSLTSDASAMVPKPCHIP
jgi:hypothetical protein